MRKPGIYTLYNIPGDPSNNVCLRFPEKNPYSKKTSSFSWNQQPRVFQKLSTWVVSFWQHFQFFFFCIGELAATLVWCAALIIFITLPFPLCVYRGALVMGQQIFDQFSPGNPQTNDKMSDLILIYSQFRYWYMVNMILVEWVKLQNNEIVLVLVLSK